MVTKLQLNNGIIIHEIMDPKFYDVIVSMKIVFELKPFENTIGNLMAHMMADRLEKTPTKQAMSTRLDFLYGAKINASTYALGHYQVLDVSVRAIRESFVEESLLPAQLELLHDMVFAPLINEQTLTEAKSNLRSQLYHAYENPSLHAWLQASELAGSGQAFGLNTYGRLEDLDAIDVTVMQAFHQRLKQEFTKEIYVSGALNEPRSYQLFEQGQTTPIQNALSATTITPKDVEVEHPGSQTELILIYETTIVPDTPLYPAYLVFMGILGQLPSSLLFQNIREKESLCYAISASRQNFEGIFFISAGINGKNRDKVVQLIAEQFAIIQHGDFDIAPAIKALTLELNGVYERNGGIANHIFRNQCLQSTVSIEDLQTQLHKVTKEDVIEVLTTISKPFIFTFKGVNA